MTLSLLTFPGLLRVPGLVHGVTTRAGGVSRGTYATLNLGRSTADDGDAVTENGRRVVEALGLDEIRYPHQVHGDAVKVVTRADVGPVGRADAVVTGDAGLGLGALGADCPAVLIVDPVHRAIAMVHSGWRGTVAGIATRAVETLVARFGTRPADCLAAIGPGISAARYEVGPEVADAVRTRVPSGRRCVVAGRGDRAYVDLSLAIRNQLAHAGLSAASIESTTRCTLADDDLFSHRRDGESTGRHAFVAGWLRPGPG